LKTFDQPNPSPSPSPNPKRKINYFRYFHRTKKIRINHLFAFLSDAKIEVVFIHKEVWEAEEFWDKLSHVLISKRGVEKWNDGKLQSAESMMMMKMKMRRGNDGNMVE
jgi:hypothetical protein